MAGQPPIYDSPEVLQERIEDYFESGVKKKTIIVGRGENKEAVEVEVPTITGLALYLGFESRQSFYDYEKREGFSYTIKNARTRIENNYEELLQHGNTPGAIFALKNMGWTDRQAIDHTSGGDKINANINWIGDNE